MAAVSGLLTRQIHSLVTQDLPPSPTLTNPDMILPERMTSASPTYNADHLASASTRSSGLSLRHIESNAEVGIATAVMAPTRVHPGQISSPTFSKYEPGGPLTIIEEQDTPKSKKSRKEVPTSPPDSPSRLRPKMQQKRLSDRSASDSSDIVDWENFDSSKMLNARLAADVAKADDYEGDEGTASKRNSVLTIPGEDEMAALNAKAERILESARKRLTHMEDTLNSARHTVLMSPRSSPNIKINQPAGGLYRSISQREHNQPAGGLYRSISQREPASHRKKPLSPLIRSNPAFHARGVSDTTAGNGHIRLSVVPEIRSASALGHSGHKEFLSPESNTQRSVYSPASTKSFNSPLRPLEEESSSPSTTGTSPDVVQPRGLGINTMAAISKPDISAIYADSPTPGHQRNTSVTSTKSTLELRTKLSDLRIRINDLRNKAHYDKDRSSPYGARTPSPSAIQQTPEQFYTSAPEYVQPGSPINQNAGQGWSPALRSAKAFEPYSKQLPITPRNQAYSNVLEVTPVGSTPATGTRTDQNTPSLARHVSVVPIMFRDSVSQVDQTFEEDGGGKDEEEPVAASEEEPVAASEEEQIYLNEVLEESLQDVEPDVPDIPEHMLIQNGEGQRHEDRYDAFDYENMFLHSAMGSYSSVGRSRSSSNASVETQRAAQATQASDIGKDDKESVRNGGSVAFESAEETILAENELPPNAHRAKEQDGVTLAHQNGVSRPPVAPSMKHARSASEDSVSTSASFATATEGDGDDQEDEDEMPQEILNWSIPEAQSGTFYQHTTPPQQATHTFPRSPPQQFSANVNSVWPTPPSTSLRSPVRTKAPSLPISPVSPMSSKNGLGITTSQFPSQALPYTPPSPHHASRNLPYSALKPFAYPSPAQTSSPYSKTKAVPPSSPQRPVQLAGGYMPTPGAEPPVSRPVDTEVLMDALIKLANPDYDRNGSTHGGDKFNEVDKDLVIDLLRATGAVIDGIQKAQKEGESYRVKVFRRALDEGRGVLEEVGGNMI